MPVSLSSLIPLAFVSFQTKSPSLLLPHTAKSNERLPLLSSPSLVGSVLNFNVIALVNKRAPVTFCSPGNLTRLLSLSRSLSGFKLVPTIPPEGLTRPDNVFGD